MSIRGSIVPVNAPCYEVRLGTRHVAHGSPYERGFLVVDLGDKTCEMRLVERAISCAEMREILRLLRGEGFTRMVIERRRGEVSRRTIDIRRRRDR